MWTASHVILVPLTHPPRATRDLPLFLIRTWRLSGAVRLSLCQHIRHLSTVVAVVALVLVSPHKMAIVRITDQLRFPLPPGYLPLHPPSKSDSSALIPNLDRKMSSHLRRDVSMAFT